MSDFAVLFKAVLINGMGWNKLFRSDKGRRRKLLLLSALAVFVTFLSITLSFVYMAGLAMFLKTIGAFHYYTAFAVLIPWICIFFVCLYMMPGYLLAFKDFDLLMAFPVRPSSILLSRMLFLYLINLALSVLIGLPIFVIQGMHTPVGIFYVAASVLSVPFIPLIPMIVAALAAYAIGTFSLRFHTAQYFLLAASLIMLLLFFAVPLAFAGGAPEQTQNLLGIIQKMSAILFPSSLLMKALDDSDAGALLIYLLANAVPFFLFTVLFSKRFMTMNAKMKETHRSASFQVTSLKTSTVLMALIRKEMHSYFTNYVYVINTAFGMVLLTFFVLVFAVSGIPYVQQIIEVLRANHTLLPALTAMLTFPVCMTCTTACSVSLDGKTIWMDKSLPVAVQTIFKSKIFLNLAIIVPLLLIDILILTPAFSLSFAEGALLFFIPLLYSLLIAEGGLLINLFFPKLVWDSPVTVVKQSLSVLVAAGTGIAAAGLPAAVYLVIRPERFWPFAGGLIFILLIADLWIRYMLKSAGVRMYRNLE